MNYEVPHAIAEGKKVADLASIEMKQPTIEQLFDCLVNIDDVSQFIRIPTRMFKGPKGHELAAVTI